MLVALAVAWIAVGAVSVVVMHGRGHDVFSWSRLFLVLGPLAVPLAVSAARHVPPEPPRSAHDGRPDVLVAHDGSAAAAAALDTAVTMLGTGMTSLTLAAVVPMEATSTVQGRTVIDDVQARLDEAARAVVSAVAAPVDTVVDVARKLSTGASVPVLVGPSPS